MKNLIGIIRGGAEPIAAGISGTFVRNFVLVVGAAALIGGCRSAPVYDVMAAPLPRGAAMEDVTNAIVRAGTRAGWEIRPEQPGQLTGRYIRGSHNAVVDIIHDTKTYTIRYRESTLGGSGGTIHPLYNTWVQNLNNSISGELLSLR